MTEKSIRVAVGQFHELTRDKMLFAAQLGIKGIQLNTPLLPGETHWETKDLVGLVDTAAEYGLEIEAIENVPTHFYHKALLGQPGRDEQIEHYQTILRNMARAGIPVLGLHFMPNSVWRTERMAPGRGGAGCTKFDMAVVDALETVEEMRALMPTTLGRQETMPVFAKNGPVVDAEQMFDNYRYFINAVLPVAEQEGMKIALHPDDPPVEMLGGVARIFRRPEDFKRAWALNPDSPAWGLNLCLGCCSEMPGGATNVREMIEFFGPKGRIHYAHFRDVQGTVPDFQECFIGEGNFDPAEVMSLLKKNGFKGFLLDDHVPHMEGDSDWNHRGRAHAIGYMQGLLRMSDLMGV